MLGSVVGEGSGGLDEGEKLRGVRGALDGCA